MRSTTHYKNAGKNLSSGVKKEPSDSASKIDGQDQAPQPTSVVGAKQMTDWKERCSFRWVERGSGYDLGNYRILQQKWIKAHPQMQGERITWDEEWRDVPLVREEDDA